MAAVAGQPKLKRRSAAEFLRERWGSQGLKRFLSRQGAPTAFLICWRRPQEQGQLRLGTCSGGRSPSFVGAQPRLEWLHVPGNT